MQIHDKLKALRHSKDWTQEDLAEKLGWTVNTYAKIERGEADIKLDKLKKLAKVLDVDARELLNTDDKTILNFAENFNHTNQHCMIVLSETQCAHELEKAQLLLAERNKEIGYLKEENARLKEMMALLKQSGQAKA